MLVFFFFQAEDGIRDRSPSRGLGDVYKRQGFDFILADLGVSSMQIDNPKRGFSFRADGPLDLRLNQQKGISAAERLDQISREELAGMLYENSDEPYCEEIAKAITDETVSYTHLRAHETDSYLVCRLLLEKKKRKQK